MADQGGTENQPGAGPDGGIENPQPQLSFTQLAESSESVVQPETVRDRRKTILRAIGDATLILREEDSEVSIFDQHGEQVEVPGNLTIADWKSVRDSAGLGVNDDMTIIDTLPEGEPGYMTPGDLPIELQPVARRIVGSQGTMELPNEAWKLDSRNLSNIAVDFTGDSVVMYESGSNNALAFRRKNDAGEDLSIRNWTRVDTLADPSQQNIPGSISERFNNAETAGIQGIFTTTNDRSIIVSKDKFVIKRTGEDPSAPPLFTENLAQVGNNICEDTSLNNTGVIYYCSEDTQSIHKLDTKAQSPSPQEMTLPDNQEFRGVRNLRLDPSGNFITFSSNEGFIILDKETLEERGRLEHFAQGMLDDQGRIHGLNNQGKLVIYNVDFDGLIAQIEQRRAAEAVFAADSRVDQDPGAARLSELETKYKNYLPIREDMVTRLTGDLQSVSALDQIGDQRTRLEQRLQLLRDEGKIPLKAIDELLQPALEKVIKDQEQVVARGLISQDVESLQNFIQNGLTADTIDQGRDLLTNLATLRGLVSDDEAIRQQMQELTEQFDSATTTFKREQNERMVSITEEILDRAKVMISAIMTRSRLAEWADGIELSALKSELGNLRVLSIPENRGLISATEQQIYKAIKEQRDQLLEQEAVTGSTSTDRREAQIKAFEDDINGIITVLKDIGAQDRDRINTYLDNSDRYSTLREKINELEATDHDAFIRLQRKLGVSLALYVAESERNAAAVSTGDERPMVQLGDLLFPRWESKERVRRVSKTVNLEFIIDQKIPQQFIDGNIVSVGEIGIVMKNGKPGVIRRRLFEGRDDEDTWRSGTMLYKGGKFAPGTMMTSEDFKRVKMDLIDWERGENSEIRKELQSLKDKFQNHFLRRPVELPDGTRATLQEAKDSIHEIRERGESPPLMYVDTKSGGTIQKMYRFTEGDEELEWSNKYKELMQAYGEYAVKRHVPFLERVDQLHDAPYTEAESTMGYIPEWMSHWTIDGETASHLGKMAELAERQGRLNRGIINLSGHAGTGKDVLIKMFCNMTNRPYFAFDCSKWTVEEDLAEKLTLKDGSVLYIPSAVLQAIKTPGAVVYFNEFNAMPEATQIFLHSLLDEKRTLTLSAHGGQPIKADKDNLFFSSMNPGYPGTFDPQFATRSRMDFLQIDYAPLEDPSKKGKFNVAEALRLAREVDSLTGFTYDLDLQHNDFVKIWNHNINGETNDAPAITSEQLFDLRTILAVVQMTDKLRKAFMLRFDKKRDRNALTVSQPMTGRELANCAYDLSRVATSEKSNPSGDGPLSVARKLIVDNYLPKIFEAKEREDVNSAMSGWVLEAHP